jgi:hypothetical protein
VTDPDALANLYPEAAAYVARHWAPGRLEERSKATHSSQALCVSVLITLRQRPPDQRAEILAGVACAAGMDFPANDPLDVDAEVREYAALLGERGGGTPTALDGLVTSPGGVMTIESKFTEREFGPCGQVVGARVKPADPRYDPRAPKKRHPNCTGVHAVGSDLKWTTQPAGAACRLTVRDGRREPRRYWDVAPHIFEPDVLVTPQQCPFSTDHYQLMRNLAFAYQWAENNKLPWYGFLVCLAGGAPKADALRAQVGLFRRLVKPHIRERVGVITYEAIADVLDDAGERALAAWIRERLSRALRGQ